MRTTFFKPLLLTIAITGLLLASTACTQTVSRNVLVDYSLYDGVHTYEVPLYAKY